MRLKALAEIYTMHSFAQLCNRNFCQNFAKISLNFAKFGKISKILKISAFFYKIENSSILLFNVTLDQCKGVLCVDLGESFQTHIFLQNFASIQPRTSPVKFARPLAGMQPAACRAGVTSADGGPHRGGAPAESPRRAVAARSTPAGGLIRKLNHVGVLK